MIATSNPNNIDISEIPIDNKHVVPIIVIGSIAFISICIHYVVSFIMRKIAMRSGWTFDLELIKHCSKQTLFMFPVISILLTLSFIPNIDPKIMDPIRHTLEIILIILVTWAAFGCVKASSIAIARYSLFRSRKSQTQILVTTRVAYGLVGALGAACVILTFPQGWELGAGLLASASVTALFIGLAAKPSLENLIASLQIALTQPLLLDDYVVIDGFAGNVEEILSQYIVVRSLEGRRYIIPLTRVITNTFENWSRTTESLEITFDLYVDYGIPLEDLRKQFINLVDKNEFWDRRDATLNISGLKETSMELTCTVTATNINMARVLKIQIREKLVEYILTTYPQYLPRFRHESTSPRAGIDSMKKIIPKMDEAIIL